MLQLSTSRLARRRWQPPFARNAQEPHERAHPRCSIWATRNQSVPARIEISEAWREEAGTSDQVRTRSPIYRSLGRLSDTVQGGSDNASCFCFFMPQLEGFCTRNHILNNRRCRPCRMRATACAFAALAHAISESFRQHVTFYVGGMQVLSQLSGSSIDSLCAGEAVIIWYLSVLSLCVVIRCLTHVQMAPRKCGQI